ncbi:MAG: sodium:calcium antiporter, partial [Thermodesulfobacteriota bacterium]|nr:sodium:calcium antiporter [Thermodesulfobacteriota bacterium]
FAKLLGISEAVIGLTIIAAGTSLPELATSVVASYRKQSDIAVGNIIGSNIFNILGILGISSLLSPINGTGINLIDVYVMIAVSILLFPLMLSKFEIKRWEGLILLGFYVVYIYYLVNS